RRADTARRWRSRRDKAQARSGREIPSRRLLEQVLDLTLEHGGGLGGETPMHLPHYPLAIDQISARHRLHVEGACRGVVHVRSERAAHRHALEEALGIRTGDVLVDAHDGKAALAMAAVERT